MPAGKPRASAASLKRSGLAKRQPDRYSNYNLTEGVPVDITSITPPAYLSREAKKAFTLTVVPLIQMKAIAQTDLVELTNMFVIYDEFIKARKAIADFDKEHPNPMDDLKTRKALNTWLVNSSHAFSSIAGRFGLSPSDRTRLTTQPEESSDPLDIILGG